MLEARTGRLQTLFDFALEGKKTAASNNPKLFLEAICKQTSAVTSISRLAASPQGLDTLLLALGSDTSLSFLNGQLTTFLEYIKTPELRTVCGGTVLRQVLDKLMAAPLVWESLVQAAQNQALEQRALGAFAWLLIQQLSLPVEEAITYLTVAQDPAIRKALMSSSDDIKAQGQRISRITNTLVGGLTYEQRKDIQRGPGGRHNNDFAEIHKIAIYPTEDELQFETSDVYLPRASDVAQGAQDFDGLASHIDGQFRLLRENMLCDLREELAALAQPKKWCRKPLEVRNLGLVGVHCDKRFTWSLKFICNSDLPQFRGLGRKERKKLLQDRPKFLKHGSPVCLLVNDKFITLGSLVREEDLLIRLPCTLCIQIPATDVQNVLMQLKVAGCCVRLLFLDTATFTYEPVLKQLKKMRELSLAPEIVTWQLGTLIPPPDYFLNSTMIKLLQDLSEDYSADLQSHLQLPNPTRLDKAQAECFRAALQQRVVLIQGPPGTGKSFIGSLVGKAIHLSTNEKILVVCYTHHALDDFVEHLLNLGIPDDDIVRLGTMSKATARTKSLGLKEYKQSIKFTREQWNIFNARKQRVAEYTVSLNQAFYRFMKFNPRLRNQRDLLEFLELYDDNLPFHSAFKMPEDEDGMTFVGKGGEELDEYYLVNRWVRGMDAGIFKSQVPHDCRAVWCLTKEERDQKYQKWYHEMTKELLLQVRKTGALYNRRVEEVDAVQLEKDLAVVRNKRIIACTTTAAAKYSDIIQCIAPGAVLVEEAGEILESHVLTALGPDTKHLILIGDHKQLRPKANYELSVEKGTGFDLNRSLFERLILKGFPYQTLFSQHRMRPEISALVREMTYPELKDAPETEERPDLRGFTDKLIFVNHKEGESEFSGTRELGDSKATSSKQNQFEAKMTLKCVRYLAQQGYGSDDIVVLTPYLGQLRLLHDELKVDNDPVLNDLDSHDLVRAGLMPKVTAEDSKPSLRISTIDNFQGEEAKIVVASLCRSNIDNDIGFMSAPERLNVLISRARDAMILIGNAEHFMGSRKGGDLWIRFMGLLKAGMHVYGGFPVRCERHPNRRVILQKPADFDTECPDGGCKEPCGKLLNCGMHMCPDRCHLLCNHSKMKCEIVISSECDKGHVISRECHAEDVCAVCVSEAKKAQEEAERKVKALEKEQQHFLQMTELDREIEAIMAEAKLKPFTDSAPNKTSMQEAPHSANMLNQIPEGRDHGVSDETRQQSPHDAVALKVHAQAKLQQQEEELALAQQEFEIMEQQMKEAEERSRAKAEEESHRQEELELARIRAIQLKRKVLALLQRKFKTAQTRVQSEQQLSDAEESSQAKAERARIEAVKVKRARNAKEQHRDAVREAKLWRHKNELVFPQRRYNTTQNQVRIQLQLSDAEDSSQAKVERASIQAIKLKQARDAKEHRLNTPREAQRRRQKEVALPQRRFESAHTQLLSQQQLSGRKENLQAKVERARIQAIKLKRAEDTKERRFNAPREVQLRRQKEMLTPPLRKFETAGTQALSQQQLSDAGESSRARTERARIQSIKFKRAQNAEEHRLKVPGEAQLHKHKQEQHTQKKLRDLGIGGARFRHFKQSGSYPYAVGNYFVSDKAPGL